MCGYPTRTCHTCQREASGRTPSRNARRSGEPPPTDVHRDYLTWFVFAAIFAGLVIVIDALVAGNNHVLENALAVIGAMPVTIVTILWMRAALWDAKKKQER